MGDESVGYALRVPRRFTGFVLATDLAGNPGSGARIVWVSRVATALECGEELFGRLGAKRGSIALAAGQ